MSAWIVEKSHIDFLVGLSMFGRVSDAMMVRNPDHTDTEVWGLVNDLNPVHGREVSADRVGYHLWRENFRSVDHRYRETNQTAELDAYTYPYNVHYRFDRIPRERLTLIAFKAISCYEYQSCEHDGWSTSWANEYCDRLRQRVIGMLPGYHADGLPGWGIDSLDDIFPPSNARRIM